MSGTPELDQHVAHVTGDNVYLLAMAGAVIACRFQDLDTTAWLIDEPDKRGLIMGRNVTMWAEHALQHGDIHLVTHYLEVDGGTRRASVPQAAAIWLRYDQPDSPPPLPDRYEQRITEDCGPYAYRFRELDTLFEKHHPRDRGPHHYLAFLAAVHAGLGQGTALLAHHLPVLDREQLGAFLVAADERSRDLYARFGFEVLASVLELPRADGPAHVMYPMWRNPTAPRAAPRAVHAGMPCNRSTDASF